MLSVGCRSALHMRSPLDDARAGSSFKEFVLPERGDLGAGAYYAAGCQRGAWRVQAPAHFAMPLSELRTMPSLSTSSAGGQAHARVPAAADGAIPAQPLPPRLTWEHSSACALTSKIVQLDGGHAHPRPARSYARARSLPPAWLAL